MSVKSENLAWSKGRRRLLRIRGKELPATRYSVVSRRFCLLVCITTKNFVHFIHVSKLDILF